MPYLYGGYLLTREEVWNWALQSIPADKADTWKKHDLNLAGYEAFEVVAAEVEAEFNLARVLPINQGFTISSGLTPNRILVTSRKYFEDETCRPEDPVEGNSDDEIHVRQYLRSKGIEPKFCVDMHKSLYYLKDLCD